MIINTVEIIVPNWFDKEDIESIINKKITDEKFSLFKAHINNSYLMDYLSEAMRDQYEEFEKEGE